MSYRKTRISDTISFTQGGTGATASNLEIKFGETYSILDFGAVGDGATDDTTAIQNALDAMDQGDTLLFPNGKYLISSVIDINKRGITLKGSNVGAESNRVYNQGPLIINNTAPADFFVFSTFQATFSILYSNPTTSILTFTAGNIKASNVTFDGLQFYSNIGASITGTVIDGVAADSLTVKNCRFTHVGLAIDCPNSPGTGSVMILNNSFDNCNINSNDQVISIGNTLTRIIDNEFNDINGDCIAYGPSTTQTRQVFILRNLFVPNGGEDGADISTVGDSGSVSADWIISNNVFRGSGGNARTVTIDGLRSFIISDNTFRNNTRINIINGAKDGLIEGNVFANLALDNDLINNDGDRITITGNHLLSLRPTNLVVIGPSGESNTVANNTYLGETGAFIPIVDAVSDSGFSSNILTGEGFTGLTGETGATGMTGLTGETGATGAFSDEQIDILILAPAQENYPLRLSAKFPVTVVNMTHRLNSGTTSATLEIDGVAIGGLEDLAISASEGTDGATGANTLAAGQELSVQLTGETSPLVLSLSIQTERI